MSKTSSPWGLRHTRPSAQTQASECLQCKISKLYGKHQKKNEEKLSKNLRFKKFSLSLRVDCFKIFTNRLTLRPRQSLRKKV